LTLPSTNTTKSEDNVTKAIPYFAVTIFIGLVLVVVYDYFMVVR